MARVKEFQQDQVLDKAVELFWEKGYNATSIQDLVDWLGINRSSLYESFGGKQELFEKALERYRESNKERVVKFLHEQPSVREGLYSLMKSSLPDSPVLEGSKGCLVVNTTTELLPGDTWVVEALDKHQSDFEEIFYVYLKTGVKSGEISPEKDLKSIASTLFTFYSGINVVSKVKSDRDELLTSIRTALSVLD